MSIGVEGRLEMADALGMPREFLTTRVSFALHAFLTVATLVVGITSLH